MITAIPSSQQSMASVSPALSVAAVAAPMAAPALAPKMVFPLLTRFVPRLNPASLFLQAGVMATTLFATTAGLEVAQKGSLAQVDWQKALLHGLGGAVFTLIPGLVGYHSFVGNVGLSTLAGVGLAALEGHQMSMSEIATSALIQGALFGAASFVAWKAIEANVEQHVFNANSVLRRQFSDHTRRPLFVGNFRNRLNLEQQKSVIERTSTLLSHLKTSKTAKADIVFLPTDYAMKDARQAVSVLISNTDSPFKRFEIGAQRVHSPTMKIPVGGEYIENMGTARYAFVDNKDPVTRLAGNLAYSAIDDLANSQVLAAIAAGKKTIVSVGEARKVTNKLELLRVLDSRLKARLKGVDAEQIAHGQRAGLVVAYTPKIANTVKHPVDDNLVDGIHAFLRNGLQRHFDDDAIGHTTRMIYGGRIRHQNVERYIKQPNVDGVLLESTATAQVSRAQMMDGGIYNELKAIEMIGTRPRNVPEMAVTVVRGMGVV